MHGAVVTQVVQLDVRVQGVARQIDVLTTFLQRKISILYLELWWLDY